MDSSNPYAPPSSAVAAPPRDKMNRPTSGKLLLVFLGWSSFGVGSVYFGLREQVATLHSDRVSIAATLMLVQAGAMLVPFIVILTAKRSQIGYWTGAISLGVICCFRVAEIIATLTEVGNEGVFLQVISMKVAAVLVIWLFLAFTFGHPSRTYYRMNPSATDRRTWGSEAARPQRAGRNRRWSSGRRSS